MAAELSNDKHERFCREYVKDLNATQAAIRAGYSEESARSQGSLLLTNPNIEKRITELKRGLSKKLEISAERVAREFAKIAFGKIHDAIELIDGAVYVKDWDAMPEDVKDCIQEVKNTKFGVQIKFYDKQRALENLGKHLGFYELDNVQKAGTETAQEKFDRIMGAVEPGTEENGD